jgi:hypothetical protein
MSGKQTLIARAPDGSVIKYRTGAGYTFAGLKQGGSGWYLVTKGWSQDSVLSRTRAQGGNWAVVPFEVNASYTGIPEAIVKHFDRKRLPGDRREKLLVTQTFRTGFATNNGWTPMMSPVEPTYDAIRKLRSAGVSSIAVTGYGVPADFTVHELLAPTERPLFPGRLI